MPLEGGDLSLEDRNKLCPWRAVSCPWRTVINYALEGGELSLKDCNMKICPWRAESLVIRRDKDDFGSHDPTLLNVLRC